MPPQMSVDIMRMLLKQSEIHVEGSVLLVQQCQYGNINLLQLTLKLCFQGNGLGDLKRTLVFRLQSTISLSSHISFLLSLSAWTDEKIDINVKVFKSYIYEIHLFNYA